MKVKYVGPHTEGVEIADTGEFVGHGETVEVADALGRSLLDQSDNWQPATKAIKADPKEDDK